MKIQTKDWLSAKDWGSEVAEVKGDSREYEGRELKGRKEGRKKRLLSVCTALALIGSNLAGVGVSDVNAHPGPDISHGFYLPTMMQFYTEAHLQAYPRRIGARKPYKTLRRIVLDPGHGGENEGAHGVTDHYEKTLTLQLAFALKERLRHDHPEVHVFLTRTEDKTMKLSERVSYANGRKADLFLSLHYNAAVHDRALGYEAYYLTDADQRKTCKMPKKRELTCRKQHIDSELIAREVVAKFESKHPGMLNRGVKQANFGVLRGAQMPAIVVEAGFMTHPKEGKEVVTPEHRRRTVDALVEAIEAFDAKRGGDGKKLD